MALRNILRGIFLTLLLIGAFGAAHALDACGINSGSDPFLYEVVRQSYVYSALAHQAKKTGDCGPLNDIKAMFQERKG